MYLLWYCDNPKLTTATKLAEAIQAYADRFKSAPNVILMNKDELIEIKGMQTRAEGYIRKFNYWIGWEDAAGKASDGRAG